MAKIFKKIFLALLLILLANTILVQFMDVDGVVLTDMAKALVIALLVQPWVIRQLTY